jgi:hypothetical protein
MQRPVRQRLRPPPRTPRFAEISWNREKAPELAASCTCPRSKRRRIGNWGAFSALCSLASKSRFPETETASGGDLV